MAVLAALQPLPMKLFVDNALGGAELTGLTRRVLDGLGVTPTRSSLSVVAALATVVMAVVVATCGGLIGSLWENAGARMVRHASSDVFDRLQRFSLSYHAAHTTGDSMARITRDPSSVYTATNAMLIGPMTGIMTIVTVGWTAWRLDPELTLIVMVLSPALAIPARRIGGALRQGATISRQNDVAVSSFVVRTIHTLPVVQEFAAEDRNLDTFRQLTTSARGSSRRTVVINAFAEMLGSTTSAVTTAVVFVVAGQRVLDGGLSLGALLVFVAYARTIESQILGLLSAHRQVRLAEPGLERVSEVLGGVGGVVDPVVPVAVPVPVVGGGLSVVLEGVTFGYVPARPVLRGVDLRVEAGQVVALVGATGAGKSTLVSLIPRLVDPWEGRVVLGGLDVRDARVRDVRGLVAMVRQEPLLLPVSIGENIAYGRPGASAHEVERAAREALVWEFVERLPDGLDTVVGERGATLSGGQRQRVAIARALLKDAPVLVLDEPTSALDAESESLVMAALDRVCVGRTVLVIAHRLSTVRAADRVVVLEHGMVLEQGSHAELLALNGTYAHYHNLQLLESK